MLKLTKVPAGLALAAVLTALLSTSAAQAQMRGDFDQADVNHDGRVTPQEFQAYATQRLSASDNPMAARFKQLSPDQQAARLKQRFDKADNGRKGYLTKQDWTGS